MSRPSFSCTMAQDARWPTSPKFPGLTLETEGGSASWAVFSTNRVYRYLLGRRWGDEPAVLWLLTNPSKAGAFWSDHTVIVGSEFSKRNGFGGMIFGNLKAFIATKPRDLSNARASGIDVVGPDNDRCIDWALLQTVGRIIVAWGANGTALGLDQLMLRRLHARGFTPMCLGTTNDGHPRHPLRLKYSTPLTPMPVTAIAEGAIQHLRDKQNNAET